MARQAGCGYKQQQLHAAAHGQCLMHSVEYKSPQQQRALYLLPCRIFLELLSLQQRFSMLGGCCSSASAPVAARRGDLPDAAASSWHISEVCLAACESHVCET